MPGLPYGESIGYATREEAVRVRPVSVSQQQKQHGLTSQSLSVVGQWKVGDGGGGGGGRGLALLHKYLHPPTWRIPPLAAYVHTPGAAPHSSRLHSSSG